MSRTSPVRTGLDVLCARDFAPLRGPRIGLVTHGAAVNAQLRPALEIFESAHGLQAAALFGPWHGLQGTAQYLIPVDSSHDSSGLRIHSLYGNTFESLSPTSEQLEGLDTLVVDLVDVGSRYYTFQATMLLCMEAASQQRMRVV